ncbi:MAG TPA: PsiF family protein [Pseudorhodoferax sp.]|nr:PsiF family protein [Pseudorhodoferax sp.]
MLKTASLILAAAFALSLGSAHAADDAKPGSKLGACSKEAAAKGLKGDERNKYLSDCNKGLTAAAPAAADKPGSKLGACSKEAAAKGLKGDERNKYLSDCNKA